MWSDKGGKSDGVGTVTAGRASEACAGARGAAQGGADDDPSY